MLPPTVRTIQIPRVMAMSILCHDSKGGSTVGGTSSVEYNIVFILGD